MERREQGRLSWGLGRGWVGGDRNLSREEEKGCIITPFSKMRN